MVFSLTHTEFEISDHSMCAGVRDTATVKRTDEEEDLLNSWITY